MDASDVVQDVLLEANQRLPEFLREAKIPFHLWLRPGRWASPRRPGMRYLRALSRLRSILDERPSALEYDGLSSSRPIDQPRAPCAPRNLLAPAP